MDTAIQNPGRNWVLAAMILASSMAGIDASALNVALPALQKGLAATGSQLIWVVNAYALMLAALILVGGSLGDLFGRKKIMLTGMAIFTLSSLMCGLSPSIEVLIISRTIQGLGGALMIPGSLAIISATFDAGERGKAIGVWSSAGAITVVLGPVLGGFLTGIGLWRSIFLINIPLGLFTFMLIVYKVPESRNPELTGKKNHIDSLGAFLISIGLGLATYGFTEWSLLSFSDIRVIGSLIAGTVLLCLFVLNEARASSTMMPLHLFHSRNFSGPNLLTLFLYGALTVAIFFLSINLIQVQGYSSSQAGLAFLAFPVPMILLSRYAGSLSDKFGSKWLLVIGPIITAASFLYFSRIGLTNGPGAYWSTFFPGLFVFGFGMSLTVVPLTNTVMGSVGNDLSGTASGINNAVTRIASVLALAILGSLAIGFFSTNLERNTKNLNLSPAVRSALQLEAKKLAGARVPNSIPSGLRIKVGYEIKKSFTDMYGQLLKICAGLSILSGIMAFILIDRNQAQTKPVT